MKKFCYTYKHEDRILRDVLYAHDIEQAANIIEKNGYTILRLEEASEVLNADSIKTVEGFKIKEKKAFFSSLNRQYRSGVPIIEIFENIANSSSNEKVKNLSHSIANQLKEGQSFDVVISRYVNILGKTNAMLLIAGEEAGKIHETSNGILKNIEKEEAIINNLISKSTYPLIIIGLAIFAYLVMNIFVFPQIEGAIKGGLSDENVIFVLIKKLILILLIMACGAIGVKKLFECRQIKEIILKLVFTIKAVKKAYRLFYYVAFFRVISIAYSAGCALDKAIGISAFAIGEKEIVNKISRISSMIREGTEIPSAFRISDLFSDFALSQIVAAEKTGEYDEAFKLIANDYESELNLQIKVLIDMFQLVSLLLCGVLVAITAIGFFTTYYNALFSLF